MARNFSQGFKLNLTSISPEENILYALEINHKALATPIRVVNDTLDLISNGETYLACGFNISLLSDSEKELPKARISVTTIKNDLQHFIESSNGAQEATITIKLLRRSEPDTIEHELTCDLLNLSVDYFTVTGTLGFDNILGRDAINVNYSSKESPGLI
jgi:hypothetical protein